MELVERKQEVRWLYAHFLVSQRRLCELMGVAESSQRYAGRRNDEELRAKLVAAAREKPRWGYRRLQIVVQQNGERVNHKRVYRVYREAGLMIRRRKRKRLLREGFVRAEVNGANQEWAADFVHDAAESGRKFRVLSVIDVYTRECLALEVDTGFAGRRITRVLEGIVGQRGKPQTLRCDNGPEFSSRHFLAWNLERGIAVVHIEPGKPVQNSHVESFHGRLREEFLNASWFSNLWEARVKIAAWKEEYNEERPHSSLGYKTPGAFAAGLRSPESCGKDATLGNPAKDAGFPLSHNSSNNNLSSGEVLRRANVV